MSVCEGDFSSLAAAANGDSQAVFEEPWEAEAFSLVVQMYDNGLFTWSEWASQLGASLSSLSEDTPYFEAWLYALERIVLEKSLLNETELSQRSNEWEHALSVTPHGEPIELNRSNKA